jgi:hypothetical protein
MSTACHTEAFKRGIESNEVLLTACRGRDDKSGGWEVLWFLVSM